MTILGFELKKLFRAKAVLGMIALCLVLNAVIVLGSYQPEISPDSPQPANVFAQFSAIDMGEYFIKKYGISEEDAVRVRGKHEKLQIVVEEKAVNGDALYIYFGYATTQIHGTCSEYCYGL